MATVMTAYGEFGATFPAVVGRISRTGAVERPEETVLVVRDTVPAGDFAAIISDCDGLPASVGRYESLDHLEDGDIVLIDGTTGFTRTLYRAGSLHNALFVTNRCDNQCIMCSQPPGEDDGGSLTVAMRLVALLKRTPPLRLTITGGEPTLLGDGFVRLLSMLATDLPETTITCLSNGRGFGNKAFARAVANIGHPEIRFSIPVHGDVPEVHDYVAQASGAFRETVAGFYNLEECGLAAEARVVLHSRSVPRLAQLSEFIWRKLPFLCQTAFMGLENTGYGRMNWSELWIDPIDYADALANAVIGMYRRGLAVSVYNIPYCILRPDIHGFARRSISDHKQTLVAECAGCQVSEHCAGFFSSCLERHSRAIRPIQLQRRRDDQTAIRVARSGGLRDFGQGRDGEC